MVREGGTDYAGADNEGLGIGLGLGRGHFQGGRSRGLEFSTFINWRLG